MQTSVSGNELRVGDVISLRRKFKEGIMRFNYVVVKVTEKRIGIRLQAVVTGKIQYVTKNRGYTLVL